MAVITVYGKTPDVGSAAFVAPNATLAGDVVLAAGSSVWYGAVVRGDTGAIRIGKNSNIQDNAVLHTGPNLGVTIGKNVSIGHSAVVHGCTVGDGALIGKPPAPPWWKPTKKMPKGMWRKPPPMRRRTSKS